MEDLVVSFQMMYHMSNSDSIRWLKCYFELWYTWLFYNRERGVKGLWSQEPDVFHTSDLVQWVLKNVAIQSTCLCIQIVLLYCEFKTLEFAEIGTLEPKVLLYEKKDFSKKKRRLTILACTEKWVSPHSGSFCEAGPHIVPCYSLLHSQRSHF